MQRTDVVAQVLSIYDAPSAVGAARRRDRDASLLDGMLVAQMRLQGRRRPIDLACSVRASLHGAMDHVCMWAAAYSNARVVHFFFIYIFIS